MSFGYQFLFLSVAVSIAGFIFGAFLNEKHIGMVMFFLGFLGGVLSAIIIFISGTRIRDGRYIIGREIMLIAIGFGFVIIGQLIDLKFQENSVAGEVLYFIGFFIMFYGIVISAIKKIKTINEREKE